MKKLSSYLTAGIAATATFQSGDAATIVTLYGPGARNPSTIPATPAGISIGIYGSKGFYGRVDLSSSTNSFFLYGTAYSKNRYFTDGGDLLNTFSAGRRYGRYRELDSFARGAQAGSANYANISFNGDDFIYEAVGQFYFDGAGGGYLIAIARNDDFSALSISAGKAAIDAVPEPSAIALLSLGAGGLMMRRRRKVA